MASHNQNAVSLEHFNYDETKKNFQQIQNRYIESRQQAIQQGKLTLWLRNKVNCFINAIKFDQKTAETAAFDVINEEGEYKLVLRSEKNPSDYRTVVPFEECFDIVVHIHRLFGHRGECKKSLQYLTNKYVIDQIALTLVAMACNLCCSCRRTEVIENFDDKSQSKKYRMFTAKMSACPAISSTVNLDDNPYQILLIVVDCLTSFVFLRPLVLYDEHNVAVELFKIFTDYGMPNVLQVSESDREFYEKVCKIIGTFIPGCVIKFSNLPEHYTDWSARVVVLLNDWMEVNASENWTIGSQAVQWNMNNTVYKDKTPYKQTFQNKPIYDLIE